MTHRNKKEISDDMPGSVHFLCPPAVSVCVVTPTQMPPTDQKQKKKECLVVR